MLNMSLSKYKHFIDEEMVVIMRQMDSPSMILDYLYLGSEWNASNLEELQNNGWVFWQPPSVDMMERLIQNKYWNIFNRNYLMFLALVCADCKYHSKMTQYRCSPLNNKAEYWVIYDMLSANEREYCSVIDLLKADSFLRVSYEMRFQTQEFLDAEQTTFISRLSRLTHPNFLAKVWVHKTWSFIVSWSLRWDLSGNWLITELSS